jgi:hypothetical protein
VRDKEYKVSSLVLRTKPDFKVWLIGVLSGAAGILKGATYRLKRKHKLAIS